MSRPRGVWLVIGRLMRVSLGHYVGGGLLWVSMFVIPLLTGLVLQALFDAISGQRAASLDAALWLCAAFVAVELLRGCVFWLALTVWPYWWNSAETTLRTNTLRSILTARGPAASRLPHSSGEAVARFRDDVRDLTMVTDNMVDLVGAFLFTIGAFAIMASIDPVITVVLVFPLTVIAILNRLMRGMVARIHRKARQLGAAVTAYIGETFAGVLAIKTAGAEDAVLERLREHNRRRRDAAVKDRLTMDMLDTATSATVEVSIGLVLLLAAPAMRTGEFTVGDFALFINYVAWLTMLPRILGRMLYRVPQGAVATQRLTRLMAAHETADNLSKRNGVWLRQDPPPAKVNVPDRVDPLEVLDVRGLSATYDDAGGVNDVDLRIERGTFTVVTGAVGAGKTTLVRAILGLLPLTSGDVRWNGQRIDDPGTFLIPDRVAYAGQVPRLF
jgi:ATP-binding cassette, subfamily B, bacterial